MTEVKDIDREAAQETDIEYTHLCKAFARHREAAEKAEREYAAMRVRVVLGGIRDHMRPEDVREFQLVADAIERGEHLGSESMDGDSRILEPEGRRMTDLLAQPVWQADKPNGY